MPELDLKNKALLKTALGVLLSGGMLAVFFFTHYVPFGYPVRREQVDALKADYEKKSTELARARASVADLPRFEAEYGQLHQRWTMAAELLPVDRQFPALLRKVTLAGEQTGVEFQMFKPSPPHPETYYTQLPVDITVNGGYHQVGAFLAELANMRRIVTVSNLKVSANTKTDEAGTASASITASAYSLNTTPAAGTAAPAAGAAGAAAAPAAAPAKNAQAGRGER
jgi:type IV pilus assembly protein PilO